MVAVALAIAIAIAAADAAAAVTTVAVVAVLRFVVGVAAVAGVPLEAKEAAPADAAAMMDGLRRANQARPSSVVCSVIRQSNYWFGR